MKKTHKIVILASDSGNLYRYKNALGMDRLMYSCFERKTSEVQQCYQLHAVSDDEVKVGDWYINTYAKCNVKPQKHRKAKALINHKKDYRFKYCKKIIATTDPSLKEKIPCNGSVYVFDLPQIPQSFMESYAKDPVDEIEIEYHESNIVDGEIFSRDGLKQTGDVICNPYPVLKVVNKEVVCSPKSSKVFTKEEVERMVDRLADAIYPNPGGQYDQAKKLFMANWKKDNLK